MYKASAQSGCTHLMELGIVEECNAGTAPRVKIGSFQIGSDMGPVCLAGWREFKVYADLGLPLQNVGLESANLRSGKQLLPFFIASQYTPFLAHLGFRMIGKEP